MNGHDFPELFDPIVDDDDEPMREYTISGKDQERIDLIAELLAELFSDDEAFEQELALLEAEANGVH